ncbi:hypothetical protein GCM10020366_27440 [Saccharopolyspora gregorii]|uniref:Amidohydrolase-related domain-containing protein n=1 Tax=Saccharopolyspora gregorii TaxID=33914 RepID=A0ABP6RP87_9PSEU
MPAQPSACRRARQAGASVPSPLGHTAEQALDLATTRTAALLGIALRTGILSPGHAADLLIVEGNPTHNLDALRHRHLVLAAGRPQAAPPTIHTALTDN